MAKRRNPPLTVLLNGRLVGEIRIATSGAISFTYAEEWLAWQHAMPISRSLPLTEQPHKGAPVIAYLENLLPDNQAIRERVAAKVNASGTDAFHMLEKIGRDCVGALQFVTEYDGSTEMPGIEGEKVSDDSIAHILKNLASAPLGIEEDDDFRISIAGAQEKSALLFMNGEWFRPKGMTPTTHILKTQLGILPNGINLSDSVENEFFCMRFCKEMGAEVAHVEIHDFGDTRALAIERFDRQWTKKGTLLRLPQEDFCQALAVPPSQKYQSDGGPSIKDSIGLLQGSNSPTEDQLAFFRAQILFWLLAATDGHAKNYSLFLRPGNSFVMTPLYDILSAQKAVDEAQVRHGQLKLAMSIGGRGHYRVDRVAPRHFLQTAKASGFGVPLVEKLLQEIHDRIPAAIEATLAQLPPDFPEALSSSIIAGVEARHRLLGLGLAAEAG